MGEPATGGAGGHTPRRSRSSGPPQTPPPTASAGADFFVCDVVDVIPKDDMASMEHPVFSLSTRPDRRVLKYVHGETMVEITPSVKGLATIHDKDILIYCVSQLIAAQNRGEPIAREVHMTAHDLLVATNRETSGDGYRRLREAFERLSGTRIVTNIATGGTETTQGFGLIDAWAIVRRTRSGRMINVRVTLSDWLYRAVLTKSVLTLHRDYFQLRKPLERRVYELARKHCGRQREWRVGLEVLLKKSGSASPRRVFRRMMRDMVEGDHLPDYAVALGADDLVSFRPRRPGLSGSAQEAGGPLLSAGIHDEARAVAPGLDPHWLEQEWRDMWAARGRPALRSPDRAFLAFCRSRATGGTQ
ncbi:replication initiator protein A (plasmid) [Paroceanicella profunda]|uniref:Replication initiator protein A n=1 Tax=Paroceanicella profunda TaxID=2579971 RepID=A0A5B8G6J6_9RHOB|nr:replication initiator protein A [Paroceanicella profunda]QDL94723.1 replication initiator protein A [Paroceanicella profunda]